jgi:phosphomannomutase
MFGEEYTLVAVSDYILSHTPGSTVSNLSSSRALRDVTLGYGCEYTASAVGEVNVVEAMNRQQAVIGGEGNGGIIYPELHYGRDALVGVALFLSHLASEEVTMSELKGRYPGYFMSKNKIVLNDLGQADRILKQVALKYQDKDPDLRDGVKIDLPNGWIHLRKSNTEPILRVYTESGSENESQELAKKVIDEISVLMQS